MKSTNNPLNTYFNHHDGKLIHKWLHYFDIYHAHFAGYRDQKITIIEFGVSHGGSLQMWKDYFGNKAEIIGVDIDPRCKELEESQVKIRIGDQEDRAFLKSLVEEFGSFDIVIEDGGHTMPQQINTFEEIFPAVKDGGTFLIEDLHTSYWKEYGGGYKNPKTFIEYAKDIIDKVNAWHSHEDNLQIDWYTRNIKAMHVYDSIIVFDKQTVFPPEHHQKGTPSF